MDTVELETPVKSKKKKREIQEHNFYTTYTYRGVPYIPHYTKPDCYVPPGYSYDSGMRDRDGGRFFTQDPNKEFTAKQLEKAGAVRVPEYLWSRYSYQKLL